MLHSEIKAYKRWFKNNDFFEISYKIFIAVPIAKELSHKDQIWNIVSFTAVKIWTFVNLLFQLILVNPCSR